MYLEADMQIQRSRLAAVWLADDETVDSNVVIGADLSFPVPAVSAFALIRPVDRPT
jgi:hypothetical protein